MQSFLSRSWCTREDDLMGACAVGAGRWRKGSGNVGATPASQTATMSSRQRRRSTASAHLVGGSWHRVQGPALLGAWLGFE